MTSAPEDMDTVELFSYVIGHAEGTIQAINASLQTINQRLAEFDPPFTSQQTQALLLLAERRGHLNSVVADLRLMRSIQPPVAGSIPDEPRVRQTLLKVLKASQAVLDQLK